MSRCTSSPSRKTASRDKRGPREVESAPSVGAEIGRDPLVLFASRQPAPILVIAGCSARRWTTWYDSPRSVQWIVEPQRGVPRDQAMPRLAEGGKVEFAPQATDELLDVMARLRVGEGVEEHPVLHRRERIEILDAAAVRESGSDRLEVDALGSQLERRRRGRRTSARALLIRARSGRRRQVGDVGAAEELGRVQLQTRLPRPRHHPDAEDRVDADVEEVLVDADTLAAQQLGRDPGEYLLRDGARGATYSVDESSPSCVAGGRSADRSTLPLGESGSASRKTYEDGTIGSGHAVLQPAPEFRRRRDRRRPPARRRRRAVSRRGDPRGPRRPLRSRPGAASARPRSRRARCGRRAPSPGRRGGPAARGRRLRAIGRGRRSRTSAIRVGRAGRGGTARPSVRDGRRSPEPRRGRRCRARRSRPPAPARPARPGRTSASRVMGGRSGPCPSRRTPSGDPSKQALSIVASVRPYELTTRPSGPTSRQSRRYRRVAQRVGADGQQPDAG